MLLAEAAFTFKASPDSKTVDNLVKGTMVLESGDALKVKAASANNIAGIVSYVEIFDEKSA